MLFVGNKPLTQTTTLHCSISSGAIANMLKFATKFVPDLPHFQGASAAGYSFAEFFLNGKLLDRWQEIAEAAQGFSMGYALHFPNRGDLTASQLSAAVNLFRELDCSAIVIHEPMRRRYQDALLQRDSSLPLGVENHRLDPDGFARWADENVWLTLDCEHLWKYTLGDAPLNRFLAEVRDFLLAYGSKLVHVHLPGYLPGHEEHRPMYCSRDMVHGVFTLLADVGFAGLIVSEVNPQYQNVLELQMDVLLQRRWLELREGQSAPSCAGSSGNC